jgi:hypothetical protein
MKRKILITLLLSLILIMADCWYSMYLNPRAMPAVAASNCADGQVGRIVNVRGGRVEIKRDSNPNAIASAQVGTTLCCRDILRPGRGVRVTIGCNLGNVNRNMPVGDGQSLYSVNSTCLPSQMDQRSPCVSSGGSGGAGGGPGKR